MQKKIYKHLLLKNSSQIINYSARPAPIFPSFPKGINRMSHGKHLSDTLKSVTQDQAQKTHNIPDEEIRYLITFDSFEGYEIAVDSLTTFGITLSNIQEVPSLNNKESVLQKVTVSIPKKSLSKFETKISEYLTQETTKGKPKNEKLIQSISDLKSSSLKDLWNDDFALYPENYDEKYWFEIWLRNNDKDLFLSLTQKYTIKTNNQCLTFPEQSILLINCSINQLSEHFELQSYIANFSLSKSTTFFFDELPPTEQAEWAEDLKSRCKYNHSNNVICILDTGVNYKHPLLNPIMSSADQLTEDPNIIAADEHGHGTFMAGIAAYGNMLPMLESQDKYNIDHNIESVKVLTGKDDTSYKNHGYVTQNAVYTCEIANPDKNRIFVMPLTTDAPEHGKPTAWSSAIDALCADSFNNETSQDPRLFILAAGNISNRVPNQQVQYPLENENQEVFNPGQAWNAITVGAITYLTNIEESSTYSIVANPGELSPHSSTSVSAQWDANMPLKPEIVFEGGNLGKDQYSNCSLPSLSLLTTYHEFTDRLFTTFNATSASSSIAANFAIKVLSKYPNLWPQTIRGLMIHSADWNKALYKQFGADLLKKDGKILKGKERELAKRLRERVGFGQPNLQKAIASFNNSAVIILEEEFQPYRETAKKTIGSNMMIVDLPWPKSALEGLFDLELRLTITLSYFIEPNPSGQATGKYSYPSHQLKFDIKRSDESPENFLIRINNILAEEAEKEGIRKQDVGDDNWLFGINQRSRGSIHKDIWNGNATELASRNQLAIYPTTGWWKTRKQLKKYNSKTKLALIISLETIDNNDVEIYTLIENEINLKVQTPVTVTV